MNFEKERSLRPRCGRNCSLILNTETLDTKLWTLKTFLAQRWTLNDKLFVQGGWHWRSFSEGPFVFVTLNPKLLCRGDGIGERVKLSVYRQGRTFEVLVNRCSVASIREVTLSCDLPTEP